MTSKPVTGIRVKDGKVTASKRYATKRSHLKAARLARAWAERSKSNVHESVEDAGKDGAGHRNLRFKPVTRSD